MPAGAGLRLERTIRSQDAAARGIPLLFSDVESPMDSNATTIIADPVPDHPLLKGRQEIGRGDLAP